MEENQQLQQLSKPIGYSESTGMDVYQSFTATSGFNYFVGARNLNGLMIVEQIAEGTACTYLCGISIRNQADSTLLSEIQIPRFTRYTRDKVVKYVRKSVLDLLVSSVEKTGNKIDLKAATKMVDDMLDTCYFERSRASIIDWARTHGIIKN